MNRKYRVKYYFNCNGISPVENFINTLNPGVRSKIIKTFQIIEDFGIDLIRDKIKKLTGTPLWEIRFLGKDNIRVIYFYYKEKQLLILHGFAKKKQKTPSKDIKTALTRYKRFID